MDKSCVPECPVDCIYEGGRSPHINPDECVDCGACKLICRVEAIYYETDLPPEELVHRPDNAAFFNETLPGREGPLGAPGGADTVGRVGVDTPWSPTCRRAPSHRIRRRNRRRSVSNCALRADHSKSTVCSVAGNGAGGQWHRQQPLICSLVFLLSFAVCPVLLVLCERYLWRDRRVAVIRR